MFHRYLTPSNRGEPALVSKTGYLKGGEARVLAAGLRIQALAGPHAPSFDTYDFVTKIPHRESLGFRDGKIMVREVYWNEGDPGVAYFPVEKLVGIPATVTRFPIP